MKNIFNFLQAFFLFRYTVDDNYTKCHRKTISLKDTILTMKKIAATFLVSPKVKVKNTFFVVNKPSYKSTSMPCDKNMLNAPVAPSVFNTPLC